MFQQLENVGGARPQDVGRGPLLTLHRRLYGDVHRTSFRDMLRMFSGHNFNEWVVANLNYVLLCYIL